MKTTVRLPDPLFESAEALAAELGISRNQLYVTAIQKFVQGQNRNEITEALNRVYEKVDQSPDPLLESTEDVGLISVSEARSLELTLHELRSPKNAARLFAALARALSRETDPPSVEALREETVREKSK